MIFFNMKPHLSPSHPTKNVDEMLKALVLLLTNIELRDVEDFPSLYHILSFYIEFQRICSPSGRYKFRAQEPVRKPKLL